MKNKKVISNNYSAIDPSHPSLFHTEIFLVTTRKFSDKYT